MLNKEIGNGNSSAQKVSETEISSPQNGSNGMEAEAGEYSTERRSSARIKSITNKPNYTNGNNSNDVKGSKGNSSLETSERKDGITDSMSCSTGSSDIVIAATSSVAVLVGDSDAHQVGKWLNNSTRNAGAEVAYKRVMETLKTFNEYCQQFAQGEEYKENTLHANGNNGVAGVKRKREDSSKHHDKASKPSDLKALSKMIENKAVMYPEKRFGHLPGIDVGFRFTSRIEMVALGFHGNWLHGIDCMEQPHRAMEEFKGLAFPLAVAVVLSDENKENMCYSEYTIFTDKTESGLVGQRVSRDNKALKNNLEQSIPVRVAQGHKSEMNPHGKAFTYDGLYEVVECSIQKGVSGDLIYKYHLRQLVGQAVVQNKKVSVIEKTEVGISSRLTGLVCMDISGGQEEICIPAFNAVDDTPFPPPGFTYSKCMQFEKNVDHPVDAEGCKCKRICTHPKACACSRLNGSKFPYVRQGRSRGGLNKAKDVVFECGPSCSCGPDCTNRASQRGIRYHLEVFRTENSGWAVRTRDFIPRGAPVCEYIGLLRRTAEADKDNENDYVFEIDCLHTIMGVDGREKRLGSIPASIRKDLEKIDEKVLQSTPEFCIDACNVGNIARFINHSCEPNMFVQCILNGHFDFRLARIVLFASEDIAPLQEIKYDYGYALDSVVDANGNIKVKPCYCGEEICRGRLY